MCLHSVKGGLSHWTGCYLCAKKMLCQSLSVGVVCADLYICVVTATFFWDQTSQFQKCFLQCPGSVWSQGCFRPPLCDPHHFAVHLFLMGHVSILHNMGTSMVPPRTPFVVKNDH